MTSRLGLEVGGRQDWRLVPAALVVWLATMAGLLLGWWWTAVAGLIGLVVGVVAVRAGGRTAVARWWRRGMAWSLLVCGLLVGLVGTLRLRAAAEDPLRAPADAGASAVVRVEVTERPKPVFSAGFGGQQGGVWTVVVPSRVVSAVVAGRPVDTTGAVVVIAPADRWRALLPGQYVTATAVLAPAQPGTLTVAVLRVRGPPEAVTGPRCGSGSRRRCVPGCETRLECWIRSHVGCCPRWSSATRTSCRSRWWTSSGRRGLRTCWL